MQTFETEIQFMDFVRRVAENNIERDGSDPEFVANHVITSLSVIDDDTVAINFSGEPWLDPNQERVRPSEVIRWCNNEMTADDVQGDFRETAVQVLADKIAEEQQQIQH